MDLVSVLREEDRDWTMVMETSPLAARVVFDCRAWFVPWDGLGVARIPAGSLCVEAMVDKGPVHLSVVLPTGYLLPVSPSAARPYWFETLKYLTREWLAVSPGGRIVWAANDGVRSLTALRDEGSLSAERFFSAKARLEEMISVASGGLPAVSRESDVLAGFYNWVTSAARTSSRAQADILDLVYQSLLRQTSTPVDGLESINSAGDCVRRLDI